MSKISLLELKKSLTIEDRIDKLRKRHLIIDDDQLLYYYIKNINTYYHITGYRFLLDNYNAKEDDYHNHKSTELIALCELDKRISMLLFREVRKIEESLRTRLANLCGQDDMVTFKLDEIQKISLLEENYCIINNSRVKFIADDAYYNILSKTLYDDIYKMREEPAIKHYIAEYNGIIPIWVAINFISFGTLIKLIDCLTTVKLNEFMENNSYKKAKGSMNPSRIDLKAVHMLRNKISHHSNILGKQSPYIVRGQFYSIFFLGYISICRWSNFLFKENLTLSLRKKMDEVIEKTNKEYNTMFDFSIIHNRKIK
jgi:abortive infection bacteriophage resistance protein